MNLATLKTLLLDGDGVLWYDTQAHPAFLRFFEVLQQRGIRWALLTNNNTKTVTDYVNKLTGFGARTEPSQVFTSSTVTAEYLLKRFGAGAPVHAVGMSGLIQALRDAGLNVTTGEEMPPHPVVAVAAGMDREITYARLKVAVRLILNGAVFIATNTDPTFVTPEGLNPGTGLIIGALQGATHIEPLVIGKPADAIYTAAMRHFGADPATTAMLGDRLDTDILGAQRVGIGSIAVLTGVTSAAELKTSTIQPDFVFDSIGELTEALAGA